MLSRVAERVYWMARYLERTENTARLINVYSSMLLDLPGRMEINWYTLIRLFNADHAFRERYGRVTEENIMRFLIADRDNPASVVSSLLNVRENVRTSLDLLPDEIWQQVNQAHIQMNAALDLIDKRHDRQNVLRAMQQAGQCIRGTLDSHMSRDNTFDFMQIGRHLERADMTSRILEMASMLLSEQRSDNMRKYEGVLWTNLLQALSARQMYVRHIHARVDGSRVLNFLLTDKVFPGSIGYSLAAMARRMQYLPDPELPMTMAQRIFEHLGEQDLSTIPANQVHPLMDYLQSELGQLHGEIAKTWFYPDYDAHPAPQAQG